MTPTAKRPDKYLRAARAAVAQDRPPRKHKVCRGGGGEKVREGRRACSHVKTTWDDPEDVYYREPIEFPEGVPEGYKPPEEVKDET